MAYLQQIKTNVGKVLDIYGITDYAKKKNPREASRSLFSPTSEIFDMGKGDQKVHLLVVLGKSRVEDTLEEYQTYL